MARHKIENVLEKGLFSARWLMAPMYVGLVGALIVLVISFLQELLHFAMSLPNLTQTHAVLGVLSLIDLTLAGNLLLIVMVAGYENFVSRMDLEEHKDNPDWKSSVDFSALKLKLVASIVAISGIHLLKIFMEAAETPERTIYWMVVIHLVFVVSGVLLALMDYISSASKTIKQSHD